MTATIPLKRVARIRYGLGQPPPTADEGVPILRATNISLGRISPENMIFANLDDLPLDRAPLLEAGEILVVRSGAYTGDSAIVTADWAGAAPGYDLRVTPDRELVDPSFLAWCLLGAEATEHMAVVSGRAAQSHLNTDELGATPVRVPTLEQQRKIAAFLDDQVGRIRSLVAERNRQITLLTEAAAASAWAAVTGVSLPGARREHPGSWVSSLPEDWSYPRVCQVARMGTGHTPSRSIPEYWLDCDIPWLTTADVHKFRRDQVDKIDDTAFHISDLGLQNSAAVLHAAKTVALSRTASAGYSVIMGKPMATSQDFATWTCGPLLDSDYLLWCLRAMRSDLLGRLALGSTHKTIYFPDLMAIRVPLPTIQEQRRAVREINQAAEAARALTDTLRLSIAKLDEFRASLITNAVIGQFSVEAANGRGVLG